MSICGGSADVKKNDNDNEFFNVVMLGTFSTPYSKEHTNVFLILNFDNLVRWEYSCDPP